MLRWNQAILPAWLSVSNSKKRCQLALVGDSVFFFCSFHHQKVMSQGSSGTSSIGGVSPTAAAEGRNAAQQKVCGSWMPVSSLPPHLAQHHPPPPAAAAPQPSRAMWPLAPLQISWRRGTHRTQWGSFYLQRRARPRAPNNALGTVGAPSISLLPLPLLLFLLSFTPLPLTVRPPSLAPPGPRDTGEGGVE